MTTKDRESAFSTFTWEDETNEEFDEELAVKQLVEAGVLDQPFFVKTSDGRSVLTLGINTNDMFYFAVSDLQIVENEYELQSLYREFERDPNYGVVIWLSRKECIQPCKRCYIDPMKLAGAWTDEMEALPKGPQS